MDNILNLLVNAEVIGNVIGAILAFLFGMIAVSFTQYIANKRSKIEITYAKAIEVPLELVKNDLKDNLKIYY